MKPHGLAFPKTFANNSAPGTGDGRSANTTSSRPDRLRKDNPDFDHEVYAWMGLSLALQLQLAMPDDRVFFIREPELDRGLAQGQKEGQGYDIPASQYVYELFIGSDKIETRHVKD